MFMRDHAADFPVQVKCKTLVVSRSGHRAWASRAESPRAVADRALAAEIHAAHAASRGRHGSPRVHAELRVRGRRVGRNRVARLMRGMDPAARRRRRFRRTTDRRHALPIAPNLLGRNFTAEAPDRVWLADLTCIRTAEGCISPRCSICARAGSSAGRWPTTSATNWPWPRSTGPSRASGRRPA